jgi:spermidine synthase
MEGTLYGFSSVLSAYLLGIALGSLAISSWVDRVRDLPRLFGALHLAIGVFVAAGVIAVPWLPWFFGHLVSWSGSEDVLHLAFAVIVPIVLLPTALFGAAFPVLIRLYTRSASEVAQGMGIAIAVNTAGSIAASLIVGFWWIPALGSDATLYLLLLLDLGVGFLVVLRFQTAQGRERLAGLATAAVLVMGVAFAYNGAHLDRALVGRWIQTPRALDYRQAVDGVLANTRLVLEGRHAVVSVHEESWGRRIRTNGMPESTRAYAEPYNSVEVDLLGLLPYLLAEHKKRGLVIGFGGGGTLDALVQTELDQIEVVELEQRVIEAADELYSGVPLPLDDPRVVLHVADGRHHLLLGRHREDTGYDVIASQPSHPWLAGAANLFTEDFFALVRDNLSEGGVFALWLNGFRIDRDSALAVMASFERVFPGGQLVAAGGGLSPWSSLILLGGRNPILWRSARIDPRIAEAGVSRALALHGFDRAEDLLALFEGAIAPFAALEPELANTDDNAFLESRIPRMRRWGSLDPRLILDRLAKNEVVLPGPEDEVDLPYLVERVLRTANGARPWPLLHRARRLVEAHGGGLGDRRRLRRAQIDLRDPATEEQARSLLEELASEPGLGTEARRVLGMYEALQRGDMRAAASHFEAAYAASGASEDAYDAARAWHRVEREKAWHWAKRVASADRARFPRLALFDAERALAENATEVELARVYQGLLRYRDTEEGRSFAGVDAAAAELALRMGDLRSARAFWDADRRSRETAAGPLRPQLYAALQKRDFERATELLEDLRRLAPSDLATLRAEAAFAHERGDDAAFDAILEEIERWAPSPRQGRFAVRRLRLLGEARESARVATPGS